MEAIFQIDDAFQAESAVYVVVSSTSGQHSALKFYPVVPSASFHNYPFRYLIQGCL
jgi:hypothetical protein